ncbi:uncharacterized protein C8Q71DRAFT_717942 [Rhodofomes roseus]|uniref:RING-type domain-containing protein n=1 Tax=Rhodofomes roseus TaxID=34475 RepID=A0ABQ8JZE1_9APHY|nr:uncharacterized protein C8Q71DRAFT_717942 [Rhodofomes roseus]KAH9829668.1 hypothetical protein C8Q71DRAFT_717942 [Rhodofomes roseus]
MHVDDATIPIAASPPPASTEPNPDSPPEAEAPPQAPRQFPPPGTLVVVQGVVNTTDVPSSDRAASSSRRPSRSTTPRPSGLQAVAGQRQGDSTSVSAARDGERHGTRNRLSSFINRSRLSPDSRSAEPPSSNRSSAVSSDLSSSIAGQDTVSAEESSIADDHDSDHDDGDAHPRPLSQGSIDVLGTLLSVAAAATAASLFSPGFAFPGANNSGNSSDAVRPMSPTPTAGLGNLAGLGALAGLGMDPSGASVGQGQGASQPRDGRDRIRNVWESVRDRLGLQPRGQSDGNASAEGDNPNEIRMRPGDMFAEMARALNIGLGLGDGNVPGTRQSDSNDGDDVPATEEGADTADAAAGDHAERPPPPEDSFERFLLNLQADLRAALSDDGAGHGESRRERNSVLSSVPSTFASSEDQQPVAGPSNPRPSADSAQMAEAAAQTSDSCAEGEDDLPPLQDVSDSDSDSDNEGDDDDDDASHDNHAERSDAPRSPRTPTPIPTGPFPFGPDTRHAGDGERRPPGVNLWRLYRFAPIPASHTAGHAAGTSAVPTNPPADAHATPSPGAPTSTTADEPDTAAPTHAEDVEDSATPSTAPATDPNANVVVPVIVVGLQSVDMNRNNDNAHTHGPDVQTQDDTRSSESDSRSLDEWRDSPTPGAGAGQSQSRGRTWQSRAASALRGLRPGRRTSRNRQNRDTGARTFLIYVIGGYYPPNHHMVTGSDSLDSYEALWELAELLGQVKPPVATREDIDNSGLQIIKSSELARYEEEGRVASNCVERCLICLEDYEPEDALRLMSCKHAYHQECVDRWLQVGRNNCPACRSKVCHA